MLIKDGLNVKNEEIKAFLMIGQSNMAGRGELDEVEPINNDNCYMLRMGRWQKMSEPVNPDRAITGIRHHSGVSLAASFADELSKAQNIKVGLIPCADGGTRLDQWMPGEVLFDHAVMQVKLAMRSSEICGILWHQGESDCFSKENISLYKDKFIKMISALKEETGIGDVPLIMGELHEGIDREWNVEDRIPMINGVFHEIAEVIPNCRVASSKGLSLKNDGIHFDSKACREFGIRYLKEYIKK